MPRSYWVETLGCPKNQVDSDKLTGTMLADGLVPADSADAADLVVVNGLHFEGWLTRLVKSSGFKGPVLVCSDGQALV